MSEQTFVVLIGNSDDKLPQRVWSRFVAAIEDTMGHLVNSVEFNGASPPSAPWQNACFVFTAEASAEHAIRSRLANTAAYYEQDSIALIVGLTAFVAAR